MMAWHPRSYKRTSTRVGGLRVYGEVPRVVVDVEGGIGIDGSATRLEREVADSQKPLCAQCTRAARTCDTPGVRVRVDRCRLLRDCEQRYWLVSECHGAREATEVRIDGLEDLIERVEVFCGE